MEDKEISIDKEITKEFLEKKIASLEARLQELYSLDIVKNSRLDRILDAEMRYYSPPGNGDINNISNNQIKNQPAPKIPSKVRAMPKGFVSPNIEHTKPINEKEIKEKNSVSQFLKNHKLLAALALIPFIILMFSLTINSNMFSGTISIPDDTSPKHNEVITKVDNSSEYLNSLLNADQDGKCKVAEQFKNKYWEENCQ